MGGRQLLFHCEWDPHIRRGTDGGTEKVFRRYADDVVSSVVDLDRAADSRRIAAESLLPPGITHDCNRMSALILIVRLSEDTSETDDQNQGGTPDRKSTPLNASPGA